MVSENNAPLGAFVKFVSRYKSYIFCFIIFIIFSCTFKSIKIVGESMEPTLLSGDRAIALLNSFIKYEPKVNDIVVFKSEEYSNHYLVKRVIGVPGDSISIIDNKLYVNGNLVTEDYILEPMITEDCGYEVGGDEIFVLGDNRNNSADSRIPSIGLVNYKEEVLGKLLVDLSNLLRK